ncbi:RNA polymerase III RPC4-domain-containing protein [Dichomitus squalens]|uniref:RNA polymerase III RPC4-domain-containing protein n=1 Tax=Dichomitus squalens TaxID=114155 RepID=A0A4Q9MRZ3_9APHY|nr:RNA polymerase III RPC4-domain-containing protein [Dichomitus squalens]
MSEQPSGSGTPGSSGSGSVAPGKAIASLAKKQGDVTRLGTQKLKFVPTLPPRRVKEEPKKDEPAPPPSADRGRGRGAERGRGRGRGRGGADAAGRGTAPRPPPVEMTASGPFAMGPALAGAPSARRTAPRSNFAPAPPPAGSAKLGAGLTQTTAPSLKKEKEREQEAERARKEEQEYSDPDEGVEIVDMENVRQMDWMAPESLRKEREVGKRNRKAKAKLKREEGVKKEDAELRGVCVMCEVMDVDREPSPEEEVNMANAVDLSESESEEELEDIIDDFAQAQAQGEEDADIRQERLYFFQFPEPFPIFHSRHAQQNADVKGKAKADSTAGEESTKKVTFAEDTKPPAATPAGGADGEATTNNAAESPTVDGVIGQLEIYESGAVKMRMHNGIVMDVTAATQPSFLQHAIYLDATKKRLCVLGEVNRRFVVTPDLDALLNAMELADNPPAFELGDGLLTMDTA